MSVETLRDRFAMAALPAIIRNEKLPTFADDAAAAYMYADAMMRARGDAAPQPTGDAVKQQMLEALRAMLEGSEYCTYDERPPRWHVMATPSVEALDLARLAILAAEKEATQ